LAQSKSLKFSRNLSAFSPSCAGPNQSLVALAFLAARIQAALVGLSRGLSSRVGRGAACRRARERGAAAPVHHPHASSSEEEAVQAGLPLDAEAACGAQQTEPRPTGGTSLGVERASSPTTHPPTSPAQALLTMLIETC
jgi:hypothetical protein